MIDKACWHLYIRNGVMKLLRRWMDGWHDGGQGVCSALLLALVDHIMRYPGVSIWGHVQAWIYTCGLLYERKLWAGGGI